VRLKATEAFKSEIERRAKIRQLVFGVQDGAVSTLGLVTGVLGATSDSHLVVLAGITAAFAGGTSMAAGEFLSSKAEREVFECELKKQVDLVDKTPYLAAEGVMKALEKEGMKREAAYRVTKLLLTDRTALLATFQEKVLGLGSAQITEPAKGAIVMGLSFMAGTFVPLLPYLLLGSLYAMYLSIAMSAATLFSIGVLKAQMANKPKIASGLEFLLIALGSAALGYAVGLALGTAQFV